MALDPEGDRTITGDELTELLDRYKHPFVAQYKPIGEPLCGRRWIDYAMDSRLIYCLRKGLPLDMDVYDAAEWSCLVELTEKSAAMGGAPVEIPDFTNGSWQELEGHSFAL